MPHRFKNRCHPRECILSSALPGRWIPAAVLKQRDRWDVMGAIARGVSRIGHHDFMETIWKLDWSRKTP